MSTVPKFIRLRSTETGQWFVDPGLRQRLIDDAEQSGSNMNDVAVRILAARFNVAVPEALGRKGGASEGHHEELMLRLPQKLNRVIEVERIKAGVTSAQDMIRRTLCEHYGLRTPPPPRRGRRPGRPTVTPTPKGEPV